MQAMIIFSTSISRFKSENCGKEGKKLQKFEYFKNQKSFFNQVFFFLIIEGLSVGEKLEI